MRDIVMVDPLHVVPTASVNSGGVKVKLSMVTTFVASCAATAPNASIAPTTGPKRIATTRARLTANRGATDRNWLIRIRMSDTLSTGQCLVDDRERLVTHFPAA